MLDGLHLFVAKSGKWGSRGRVANGPAEVDGGSDGRVGTGEVRHFSVMRKKLNGLCDAFGAGLCGIHPIAAIMLGCATEVPTIRSMHCPSASFVGSFMDEDFGAGWSNGCFVVVESAIELGFRREVWIDAGWAHEV